MTIYLLIPIVILVLFIGLAVSGLIFTAQYKARRALLGRKLATILTPSGERHDKLLKVEGNQLWDEVNGRKIPYMVKPEKSFDVWWPFGRPKIVQVSVKSYLYAEGNSEPIDPFERPPVITSEVLANLQDINFSKAMVGRSEEIVEGFHEKTAIPTILYILIGVSILISIVASVLAFQNLAITAPAPEPGLYQIPAYEEGL